MYYACWKIIYPLITRLRRCPKKKKKNDNDKREKRTREQRELEVEIHESFRVKKRKAATIGKDGQGNEEKT